MNKINCKPRGDNNVFLVACVLFSVSFLYSLYSLFNVLYFQTFLNVLFAAAICVLFFLSYLGKVKAYVPFIVLAVDVLFDNIAGYVGSGGALGVLVLAVAVLAVLCTMGILNFDMKMDLANKIKSKANDPCIVVAAAFAVVGLISIIDSLTFLQYGLSFIYIINKLCYFGGAALALYAMEVDVVYVEGDTFADQSYQEARERARTEEAAQNIRYQTYKTADGDIPMELVQQENIVKNVVLGVITLGIYWFVWWYRVCRRIRLIEGKEPSCGGELVCIIFVPFYAIYWFYTRGQRLADSSKRFGVYIKDNSVLYIVLSIFGLSIVSFILIQTELNSFADKIRLGIKDNFDSYSNPNYNYYNQQQRYQEPPKNEESHAEEYAEEEKAETEAPKESKAYTKENTDDILDVIKKLSEMKEQGILTEEEFAAKKAELLDRM